MDGIFVAALGVLCVHYIVIHRASGGEEEPKSFTSLVIKAVVITIVVGSIWAILK